MTGPFYTYVARKSGDTATFLDFGEAATEGDPARHALMLLDEHPSFDHVEIWTGETCLTVLRRRNRAPPLQA